MSFFKRILNILFIIFLTLLSSRCSSDLNSTSPTSSIFFSFLRILEFFKDSTPSSNKLLNFQHHETTHKTLSLLESKTFEDGGQNSSNSSNSTNNDTQNENKSNELTPAEIEKILHKENQALKREILSNEEGLSKDLRKSEEKIGKKLDEAELRIEEKIAQSQDILERKIGKLEERVDENIQETEESSMIIISQQIEEKEQDLGILKEEIDKLREAVNTESDFLDVCSYYSSCDECTTNPKCGWCLLEGKCVGGDNQGPNDEQCTFYSYYYCSTPSCARNTDCYSCIADPNCGWCQDENRGISICLEESGSYTGCPSEGWFHSSGEHYQCKAEEGIQSKINKREREEREAMTTMKKLNKDELTLSKKREELKEKEILEKNLEDEIALLSDEMETLKKRLENEKEKDTELKQNLENSADKVINEETGKQNNTISNASEGEVVENSGEVTETSQENGNKTEEGESNQNSSQEGEEESNEESQEEATQEGNNEEAQATEENTEETQTTNNSTTDSTTNLFLQRRRYEFSIWRNKETRLRRPSERGNLFKK